MKLKKQQEATVSEQGFFFHDEERGSHLPDLAVAAVLARQVIPGVRRLQCMRSSLQ